MVAVVRRKVYKTKRNLSGAPTRYRLWVELGDNRRRSKPRRRASALDKAFTKITSFLRAVGGKGTKRRTTSKRRGWNPSRDVHPNLYRRHATPRAAGVDEVGRMRQRRRGRR